MNSRASELSGRAVFIGLVIGLVMTAANVYLGLFAGMTVSASIPAAVFGAGIYRALFRRSGILEVNIVQTMASAGESLAAGVIFTIPALVLVGAWQDFDFWSTTLIAVAGGLLGVVFMIPLRRVLIEKSPELPYPEGVACAAVLRSTEQGGRGLRAILGGLGLGALIKFLSAGLGLASASVEYAFFWGKRVFFAGFDASPALIGVGYIVGVEVAVLVFMGGALGWLLCLPMIPLDSEMLLSSAHSLVWSLWSEKIRYIGVGAMLVGGVSSLLAVRKGVVTGLRQLAKADDGVSEPEARRANLGKGVIVPILAICFAIMLGLYQKVLVSYGLSLLTTVIMLLVTFPFVAVSSYIVGLVGSSNNPVSGVTIGVLLATSAFFLVLGLEGDSGILATLGVAAIVCCAICTASDCSQDLKTGSLVGASPRLQQLAQILGVVVPAFVIAPVLTVLHASYGIGDGLKAPQATLFASITGAIFGEGELPLVWVVGGVFLGIVVLLLDRVQRRRKNAIRLHLMPLAIGIYLPLTLSMSMFVGGLLRYLTSSDSPTKAPSGEDQGVLFASGLIAGEAVIGVLLGFFVYMGLDLSVSGIMAWVKDFLAFVVLLVVVRALLSQTKKLGR